MAKNEYSNNKYYASTFFDIIQMNIENDHNPIGNLYNILCKNLVMVSIFQHYWRFQNYIPMCINGKHLMENS